MKNFIGILTFLFLFLSTDADARRGPTDDLIKNYFYVQLPGGDRGAVYIHSENELVFVPDQTNKDYIHICQASWSYKEAVAQFTIKKAQACRVLNGHYRISYTDHQLILSGNRRHVLKTLMRR